MTCSLKNIVYDLPYYGEIKTILNLVLQPSVKSFIIMDCI